MSRNDDRSRSFTHSEALLARALGVIPLGTQTFSKSHTQYPLGAAPFFIERAQGSQVWDVDGNQYTDFVNALASVILGHCDPDITRGVIEQVGRGTIFSLASRLEIEVAELIIDMVPCAEQVRFGKNGSDATSGAIRAARAFTGRDHIAVCGYHGWHDWYIGSTARNKGVPAATRVLTHTFRYNDLASLEAIFAANPGGIAAVILEPMNVERPQDGFLEGLAVLTRDEGAVLIFDETVTGFRFANGGAQELFAVTPDLATFGKGLANGYPLSAVAGRENIMKEFEEVFFSFTMGGETLSLAAAKVALEKLRREPVIATISAVGERLIGGVKDLIARHACQLFLTIKGHPSWTFLLFDDADGTPAHEMKTLWMQEILSRGILSVGTHNLSYAHSAADIDHLLGVYDEVFPILRTAIEEKRVRQYLRCQPLVPLFQVR
jgi:glutamate-1-semialdehyde 2,1-aminomutase